MAAVVRTVSLRLLCYLILVLSALLHATEPEKDGPKKLYALDYPLVALRAGTEGEVKLGAAILPDGRVHAVHGIGPEILERAAAANLEQWLFWPSAAPALRHWQVIYRFEIKGTFEGGRLSSTFSFEYPNTVTVTAPRPIAAP